MTTSVDVFFLTFSSYTETEQCSDQFKCETGECPLLPTALSFPSSAFDEFPFLEMAITLLQDGTFLGPDVLLTLPHVV